MIFIKIFSIVSVNLMLISRITMTIAMNHESSSNKIDNDWIDKFFGRRPGVLRKDFTIHLEQKFLEHCKDGDPFDEFKIADCSILDRISDRFICEKCHHSRLYYCYTCFIISPELIGKIPMIRLPIKIDIIKHPQELNGKSTSTHAMILTTPPKDVRIFTYPDMPNDWHDLNKIFLLFPKPGSQTVQEFLQNYYHHHHNDDEQQQHCLSAEFPIERIVVIDSTWQQTKKILRNVRIQQLKTLIIDSKQTMFWRYQRGRPMNHLSTIEAIYYLLIQIHMTMFDLFNNHHDHDHHDHCHMNVNETFTTEYNGQYDNLLFFFKHTFNLIKNRYHL
nr:tRNA-uridine aminocarboxypropyltransferase 1-like isoform X1 [Dermatophagoides farinae]